MLTLRGNLWAKEWWNDWFQFFYPLKYWKPFFLFSTLSRVSSLIQTFIKSYFLHWNLWVWELWSFYTWVQITHYMSNFPPSTCVCLLLFVYDSVPVRAGSEILCQSVTTYMSWKFFPREGSHSLNWACSSGRQRSHGQPPNAADQPNQPGCQWSTMFLFDGLKTWKFKFLTST